MKKKICIFIIVIIILIIASIIVPVRIGKQWFSDGLYANSIYESPYGHYEYYYFNIYGKMIIKTSDKNNKLQSIIVELFYL